VPPVHVHTERGEGGIVGRHGIAHGKRRHTGQDLAATDALGKSLGRTRSGVTSEALRRFVAHERLSHELDASCVAPLRRDLALIAKQRGRETEPDLTTGGARVCAAECRHRPRAACSRNAKNRRHPQPLKVAWRTLVCMGSR
jgi:hypothetical protein